MIPRNSVYKRMVKSISSYPTSHNSNCSPAVLVGLTVAVNFLAAPASATSSIEELHGVIVSGFGPQNGCLLSVTSSINTINVLQPTVGLTVTVLLSTVLAYLNALFAEMLIQMDLVFATLFFRRICFSHRLYFASTIV